MVQNEFMMCLPLLLLYWETGRLFAPPRNASKRPLLALPSSCPARHCPPHAHSCNTLLTHLVYRTKSFLRTAFCAERGKHIFTVQRPKVISLLASPLSSTAALLLHPRQNPRPRHPINTAGMTHNEKRQHWLKEGAIGLGTGVLYGITVSRGGNGND